MPEPTAARRHSLRRFVLIVAGLETVMLGGYLALMSSLAMSADPLGSAIGQGMVMLTLVPLTVVAVALLLAAINRWLPLAALLSVLAIAVAVVAFVYA